MTLKIVDVKPRGGLILDIKPNLRSVRNIIPRIIKIYGETEIYLPKELGMGMPMGLLLTLTYPTTTMIVGRE